jgi:hypothetical protein
MRAVASCSLRRSSWHLRVRASACFTPTPLHSYPSLPINNMRLPISAIARPRLPARCCGIATASGRRYLTNNGFFRVSDEVREALNSKKPVVALETTIYTHGTIVSSFKETCYSDWEFRLPIPRECSSSIPPRERSPNQWRGSCHHRYSRWCSARRHGPRRVDKTGFFCRQSQHNEALKARPRLCLRFAIDQQVIQWRHDNLRHYAASTPCRNQNLWYRRSWRCPSWCRIEHGHICGFDRARSNTSDSCFQRVQELPRYPADD